MKLRKRNKALSLLLCLLLVLSLAPMGLQASAAVTVDVADFAANGATAYLDSNYSYPIKLSPGHVADQWLIEHDATGVKKLPDGLTINVNDGTISGSPTKTGKFDFTVVIRESGTGDITRQLLSITVLDSAKKPVITYAELPEATETESFTYQFKASNSPTSWQDDGSLAALGLSLSSTGRLTGTPTIPGPPPVVTKVHYFTVTAKNAYGKHDLVFFIVINPGRPEIKHDVVPALPAAVKDQQYAHTLEVTGVKAKKFSILSQSGGFSNLQIDNNGKITGMPISLGKHAIQVKVEATSNPTWSHTVVFDIEVKSRTSIENKVLADGRVNQSYKADLRFDIVPTSCTVSGLLPPGLSVSSNGGAYSVSGKPTTVGEYVFNITARNTNGNQDEKQFYIKIYSEIAGTPIIHDIKFPDAIDGDNYAHTPTADGIAPITWSLASGELPAGLTLSSTTGQVKGIPTKVGNYTFTLMAKNAVGENKRAFTIVVNSGAPEIKTNKFPNLVLNADFRTTMKAQGLAPINWNVSVGALPEGLTLDTKKGVISGKPTKTGTYSFSLKASNAKGSREKQFQIIVSEGKTFVDVSSTHWAKQEIAWTTANGILFGTSSTTFSPNLHMTRAMYVTTLYRMAGMPTVSGTLQFHDVAKNDYFYNAVLWASQKGIVKGMNPTYFGSAVSISRQDMAVMLYEYAGLIGIDRTETGSLTRFADADQVSPYASTAIKWAIGKGILQGMDGKINPRGMTTRAQVATILDRVGKIIYA